MRKNGFDSLCGFQNDPFISSVIDSEVSRARGMGFDTRNPAVMAGVVDNVNDWLKKTFGDTTLSLTTPTGTATVSRAGATYVDASDAAAAANIANTVFPSSTSSVMDFIKNHPYIVLLAVGVPVFMIMSRRGKRR